MLKIKKPTLYCVNHYKHIQYEFGDLVDHFDYSKCIINLSEDITKNKNIEEEKFNSFFDKDENQFIFENPLDFDKNYSTYFDINNYQDKDKSFIFYDDSKYSRFLKIKNLCSSIKILGYLRIYYGLPRMGKSITLIRTFKYLYNHIKFGTLYINCKSMKKKFF